MRILGVDPGSRLTGYGCVEIKSSGGRENRITPIAHGTLKLIDGNSSLEARLLKLHEELKEILLKLKPQVLVVEKVFFAKNAQSALKLGHARGVILLTAMMHGAQVVEYSPTEVKQALAGHGHADKKQIAKTVEWMTGARDFATYDASDGLALAVCHANLMMGSHLRSVAYRNTKGGMGLEI